MKKILFALSVLAVVGCKQKASGNKDILPAPENAPVTTTDSTSNSSAPATTDTVTVTTVTGKLDNNGNFVYDTGKLVDIKLPNGTTLNVGENSTENKLFTFLSDDNQKVSDDKTQGWIVLDGVFFKSGSSDLTDESQKQVDNIAAILNAFPNVALKIGGYTDNTGSADANKTVSQQRAESVKNAFQAKGVAADRLAAEGYGQEHPVCPANDTDECKAQNRRVDVRVTKK